MWKGLSAREEPGRRRPGRGRWETAALGGDAPRQLPGDNAARGWAGGARGRESNVQEPGGPSGASLQVQRCQDVAKFGERASRRACRAVGAEVPRNPGACIGVGLWCEPASNSPCGRRAARAQKGRTPLLLPDPKAGRFSLTEEKGD